jgi:hypothetical protein
MPVRSIAKLSILAIAAFAMLPPASAWAYPPFPLVYQNLFRASKGLMDEMELADKKKCLTEAEKTAFVQRVKRLEHEIDLQLGRPDFGCRQYGFAFARHTRWCTRRFAPI